MSRQHHTRFAALAGLALAVSAVAVAQQAPVVRTADAAARRSAAADTGGRDTARGQGIVIMREVFTYDGGGRRDPFYPLLMTSELRPLLSDLVLTSILFDATGRRSVAIMRDRSGNTQYRVTTGMLLGRMRVTDIRPRAVYFTIQEFGSDRRDSLVLVDTTKVRSR